VTLADNQPPHEPEASIPDLELPADPGFVSFPPRSSIEEMLLWIEQARRWFPRSFPTEEERLARKSAVEFVL